MRNKLGLGALLAALTVTGAVLAPSAFSGSDARARHGVQVIHVTSATAQEGFVDTEPAGEFSVGDTYVFSEDLFKGSKRIGDAGGECATVRITSETEAVVRCSEVFRFPDGQITTQGLITFDPAVGGTSFTWAITGGTGAYNSVHGEVSAVESNGGVNAAYDFRITR